MFGMGMPELLIILVIALLVFGAGKLPEIGSSLGKAIKGFKESSEKPDHDPEAKREISARYCPHCGKGVSADAVFCPACGKKIAES